MKTTHTPATLLSALFPNASRSCIAANAPKHPLMNCAKCGELVGHGHRCNSGKVCKRCRGKGCSSCAHGEIPRWMEVSKCCGAEMNIGGDNREGTHFNVCRKCGNACDTINPRASDTLLILTIRGQIRGGKNNMIVTRTGRHIPKKEWAKWRDDAVHQISMEMLPNDLAFPIKKPTNIRVDYFAGDKRRRDMPAILDSVFHVLEKAGVVVDDTLLWVSESSRGYDKSNPRLTITFL